MFHVMLDVDVEVYSMFNNGDCNRLDKWSDLFEYRLYLLNVLKTSRMEAFRDIRMM